MSATITRTDSHEYTVGGVPFVGVTTVIGSVIRKPALERWIGELGNAEAERVRTKAASHGTLVHALAALVAEGVPSIPMGDEDAPAQAQLDAVTNAAFAGMKNLIERNILLREQPPANSAIVSTNAPASTP